MSALKWILIAFALYLVLKFLKKRAAPWARVSVLGDSYRVTLSATSTNGRKLCLMVLCYYVRLRATIARRYTSNEDLVGDLDDAIELAVAYLKRQEESVCIHRELPFGVMRLRFVTRPYLEQSHSFFAEYLSALFTSGAADLMPDEATSGSIVFHYIALLQSVSAILSPSNRRILLDTLDATIVRLRNLPPQSSFHTVGQEFGFATRAFLTRWLESPRDDRLSLKDTHSLERQDIRFQPPAALRRLGFSLGVGIHFGSFLIYPAIVYIVGWNLYDVVAYAAPIHAVFLLVGGVLAAQGIAFYHGTAHATGSMVANAFFKHGGQNKAVVVVVCVCTIVGQWLIPAPIHAGILLPLGLGITYLFGLVSEIIGYELFARVVEKAWQEQQGQRAPYASTFAKDAAPQLNLSWIPLYLTFPHFAVLVPYSVAMFVVIGLLTKTMRSRGMLFIMLVSIAMVGVRMVVPALQRVYLRRRRYVFKVALLRKFFAKAQAKMLRNLVAPCIGLYGTIVTLTDPAYLEGRKRALSAEQEAAESIKDTLAHLGSAIQASQATWQQTVRIVLSKSDLVVIDVTQITDSLAWEIAESLSNHNPERVLLVCNLDGTSREKLNLARIVAMRLKNEGALQRNGQSDLLRQFERIPAPLIYATFPCSLVFRLHLVRRLRRCARASLGREVPSDFAREKAL